MKKLFISLLTIMVMVSCSESGGIDDNGGDNNQGGENVHTTPTITLDKSSVTFDEYADEEVVSFFSSVDWTAEVVNDRADGWLSVSPTSGVAGDAKIKIKASNNDSTDERSASVRIKAGSAQKAINVTQKQKDVINNKIYYTTSDGNKMYPYSTEPDIFGAVLISNAYKDGRWVLTFDDAVTSIGEKAFYGCTSLTSITIPESVTEIGSYAFEECTSLTSVNIPESVTSIGWMAFLNTPSLISVHITDIAAWCSIDFTDGSNPLGDLYLNGELVTDLVIPDSVTEIKSHAFDDCTSLTSVNIPDSVIKIGDSAFESCKSLTSITIPDSVAEIDDNAFLGCTSLPVENNIRYADTFAIDVTNNGLTSYTLKEGTRFIGFMAFYDCTYLTSITIPSTVTSIGSLAFWKCTSLKRITIPDSVTEIKSSAFEECTSLTSITIPESVTSIGHYAFINCKSLKSVICKPTIPPAGGACMFSYPNDSKILIPIGCTIYVPRESVNRYKSAKYWKEYADYIVW